MGRRWMLPGVLALVLVAAACGGEATATDEGLPTLSGEEATTETTVATEQDPEEALLAFAECMRQNGVEDFPDPQFGGDGPQLRIGPDEEGGIDPSADEFQQASEICGELIDRSAFAPAEEQLAEMQDAALAFAECMRENGVEDFPDPEIAGFGGGAGDAPDQDVETDLPDFDDPEVQSAFETCQDEVNFPDLGPGTGAGPGGGGDS